LIASGLRAKEIAGKLFLSVKTVSTYRSRILAKLNLGSNADLIRYALTEKVID
jgi:DNA-binding NarL/FixJ family response regulator